MNDPRDLSIDDEDATMRLLRLAGPRAPESTARAARVRAAVHAEWRDRIRRRALRRRAIVTAGLVAAAASAFIVAKSSLLDRRAAPLGERVAVVERMEGKTHRVSASADGHASPVSIDDDIRTGEWIETDRGARVGFRFLDGTSVRVDAGSRVRALSTVEVELAFGAVYVDTERDAGRFQVRTPTATARDTGTQFEVYAAGDSVRVRVRSGMVEVSDARRSVSATAGTEVTISARGAETRPIAPYGQEWDWTARVAPALDSEGVSLASFLERISREHGWTVHYADADLEIAAREILLHGSVQGLPAAEAVAVAVTTSGLWHRIDSGTVVITRSATEDSDRR